MKNSSKDENNEEEKVNKSDIKYHLIYLLSSTKLPKIHG